MRYRVDINIIFHPNKFFVKFLFPSFQGQKTMLTAVKAMRTIPPHMVVYIPMVGKVHTSSQHPHYLSSTLLPLTLMIIQENTPATSHTQAHTRTAEGSSHIQGHTRKTELSSHTQGHTQTAEAWDHIQTAGLQDNAIWSPIRWFSLRLQSFPIPGTSPVS